MTSMGWRTRCFLVDLTPRAATLGWLAKWLRVPVRTFRNIEWHILESLYNELADQHLDAYVLNPRNTENPLAVVKVGPRHIVVKNKERRLMLVVARGEIDADILSCSP